MATVTTNKATVRLISNFALTHFNGAKFFAEQAKSIEDNHAGHGLGNYSEEIAIQCSASIITAVAALEALINELFLAPGDLRNNISDFDTFFWGGEVVKRRFLLCKRKIKISGFEKKPALSKYKKAVTLLGRQPLSKTDDEYRAAETLFGFRNYLIHYKPLWDEERRDDNLEQRLTGLFETSPYSNADSSFFDNKCMSAGCSKWAVKTVVDFVEYFGNRSGFNLPKLQAFK